MRSTHNVLLYGYKRITAQTQLRWEGIKVNYKCIQIELPFVLEAAE